jgi:hypothetical protein
MSRLRSFGASLYEFIVGEDPLIAGLIIVFLAITALIAGVGAPAWWVMPAAVPAVLTVSVLRGSRRGPPKR